MNNIPNTKTTTTNSEMLPYNISQTSAVPPPMEVELAALSRDASVPSTQASSSRTETTSASLQPIFYIPNLIPLHPHLQTWFPDHTPKFEKFALLPAELRVKIWKIAAREERVVKFHYSDSETRSILVNGQTLHPGILTASKESRAEALKFYTRLQYTKKALGGPVVFVNFNVEEFVLMADGELDRRRPERYRRQLQASLTFRREDCLKIKYLTCHIFDLSKGPNVCKLLSSVKGIKVSAVSDCVGSQCARWRGRDQESNDRFLKFQVGILKSLVNRRG